MDDARADHPKLLAAGLAARGLDEACIEWCSRHNTDGIVPATVVAMLAAGHGTTSWKPLVKKLCDVGRWESIDVGYQIHGYLDYNPSAAERAVEREAAKTRKQASRLKGAAVVTNGTNGRFVTPASQRDTSVTPPYVTPESQEVSPATRPVPSPLELSSSSNLEPAVPKDDDDQAVVREALRLLAERSLVLREAEKGPVGDRKAWLATAMRRATDQHRATVEALDWAITWTPEMLANWLEPTRRHPAAKPETPHPQSPRVVRCVTCDDRPLAYDADEHGNAIPCPDCQPRIEMESF